MLRAPIVAGQFYPAAPRELADEVARLLAWHTPPRRKDVIAVVCPHAGYMYSGGVAAQVYACLEPPQSVILVGPDHFGVAQEFSIYREGEWRTPLGNVAVARDLAETLLEKCPLLSDDAPGHGRDHCLEVQLPFLQQLNPTLQIVPLLVGTLDTDKLRAVGEALGNALATVKPRPLLVASSDLNHYEPLEISQVKDRKAIQAMLKLDGDELMRQCTRHRITMCGMGAAYLTLAAAKRLGASKAELIDYRTSADAGGDESAVVGYAGLVIW